ncbi:hypothetical protein KFL_000350175 [Klebsormidium nitens]|uniref:Uncharacterized protein n=1 Tax=Klebsormidium nitens TaxID=105231 RepID=A0A1Y1HPF3_KLENI|nr:hypothetical protein KFL_000350175 [Klebsormidium nitens]|eukprot:GAQ79662.1 hypothetical protein KFL_000350175 [Klebsormidium nitens]
MEGGTVLDFIPANKVPPAPVLPRLPLHLLRKNDDSVKVATKTAANLERSKSLKGVKKVPREGQVNEGQRRKSEAGVGKVSEVKAGGAEGKGSKEKLGGPGKLTGKGLASISGSKLGAVQVGKDAEAASSGKTVPQKSLQPESQPSAVSTQSSLPATEIGTSVLSEDSIRSSETSRDAEGAAVTPGVMSSGASVESSVREESSISEASRWDSGGEQIQTPSTSYTNELSVASISQGVSDLDLGNKANNTKTPVGKVKPPLKGLPASRFAREAPHSQTLQLPEAHFSMSRTLDWDSSDQHELVLGQGPTSLQSADFLEGALSRFADQKLQFRNPLHKQRVPPAVLAKQRGVQEGRFGRPPSARSELGEVLLDGFLLCDAAGVELPEEAEVVNLCGSHLTSVEVDDMRFFERLSAVSAADNYLKMENFGGLTALTRLLLPCNKLDKLRFQPGQFEILEVLDVSFNHLTRTDLSLLSTLPRLLELYFDHNRLSGHLPADVALPGRFHRLQKLSLSANGLPSSSLTTLSKLPCLRSLSLARNPIRRIPWESIAHDTLFSSLTELDLAATRIEEAEAAAGLVHLSKSLRRIALWDTPLAVRAGSDGNGEPLESAVPILAAVAEAAARGQRWLLTKPKPRPKPALFGAQIGATVEELGKEQLADLAAAYPETQIIAALERVQKRFEAPFEATSLASESLSRSPEGSLQGDGKEGSVAGTSEAVEGLVDEYDEPMVTERELYQLANAPTPAGGLPHIDDTSAAVLALKFALKHPLVKTNPLPEHHQQLNTISKIRLDETTRRKVPLSPTRELTRTEIEQTIQDAKKEEMAANIEDILATMKARLTQVEKKLKKAGHKV